jgi:hypothetical protein
MGLRVTRIVLVFRTTRRLDAADERVAENHDRAAAAPLRHALGLAEHQAVDAVLLRLHRPDAAEAADEPLVATRRDRGR